ncbi:MAG: dihydropteroate synthase [Alphaproteobacteria bacterium]|nr:dihydropteroate synthase [Alphaproteobacteria bacterium]
MTEAIPFFEPTAIGRGTTAAAMVATGDATWLAGGVHGLAFTAVEHHSQVQTRTLSLPEMRHNYPAALELLSRPRPDFAGLAMTGAQIMGIVNVTPDSFSDGGDNFSPTTALARADAMLKAGASIIDVGGESTRPGSEPVAPEEEWRRVAPVIEDLVRQGVTVSLDSRNSSVMERAIDKGVRMINDVSALNHDPRAIEVVARSQVPVILMHMRFDPATMNRAPFYHNLLPDILGELNHAVKRADAAGIARHNLMIDPGIGFAKNSVHNQGLMAHLAGLHGLGLPLLLGASRKGLLSGDANRRVEPKHRLGSSLTAALIGLAAGVHWLRVHDVFETAQAVEVWQAITRR